MAADNGGASRPSPAPHARTGLAERMRGRVIRGGEGKVSDANIANIITVVRILFAPVFVALLLIDAGQDGPLRWAAFVLFVVGIATDGIDGMIARGRNLVSNVGILLDPIADKVLTGAALVGLTLLGELPAWVTALILIREIGITVFRFSVLKDRVIPASRGGKLKTLFQAFAISFALAPFTSLALNAGLIEIAQLSEVLNIVLMSIATILTVVTGLDYLIQARRINRAR